MMGETVAIIPARGGSVGIPRKNLQRVGDDTLVARAVRSARAAAGIHRVIVSTDDAEIALESRRAGAFIIDRPASLATSTASSESALLHALGALDRPVDVVVMLQATSPFIDPGDLDAAIGRVRLGEADAVFAVDRGLTPFDLDRWEGVNHDAAVRLRRQDLPLQVAETGAFYVMRAEGFRAAEHRFFGRVEPQLVDERFAVDIDTEVELEIARALAAHHDTEFRTPARRPAEENQP